ncbi:hypothetical protein B0H67DRAFT_595536 [Lasiosphaeris hirsuta]|uniref:Uncharacterized protein n=1 Tax=Lasiosphaeris hirsuta TaxID=260670 RepID=A0AA39ZRU9_9PEZI|nr:hypothetical protein B0H67DRAFT_595536 [Lasiosphaeris hirsuta]
MKIAPIVATFMVAATAYGAALPSADMIEAAKIDARQEAVYLGQVFPAGSEVGQRLQVFEGFNSIAFGFTIGAVELVAGVCSLFSARKASDLIECDLNTKVADVFAGDARFVASPEEPIACLFCSPD